MLCDSGLKVDFENRISAYNYDWTVLSGFNSVYTYSLYINHLFKLVNSSLNFRAYLITLDIQIEIPIYPDQGANRT